MTLGQVFQHVSFQIEENHPVADSQVFPQACANPHCQPHYSVTSCVHCVHSAKTERLLF